MELIGREGSNSCNSRIHQPGESEQGWGLSPFYHRLAPRKGLFRIFSFLNTPHPTQRIHWKSPSVQHSISLTHREIGNMWISLQGISVLESVNYLSSQDAWASLSLQRVAMPEAVEPGCSPSLPGETSQIWSGAASPAPVFVGTAA